jgi:site-specific recombinase XerD/ribosomal protein L40E
MTELIQQILERPRSKFLKRLTENQLKTLTEFDEYNFYIHLAINTRENQLKLIGRLGNDVKKEFQEMTKNDVVDWLKNININAYSRLTYQLYFQKFFKWLGKDTKDWFEKIKNAYDKTIAPSDLWSPEEIQELIKVYPETQYKALVATLFDSETRVSELCSMHVCDVEFVNGIGVIYTHESKTIKRRIELIFATEYLIPWYNIRKSQADKNDPFWISKCNRTKNKRLTSSGVYEILKYGCKLLGTTKHLHPHLLRHSMASYLRKNSYPDALHKKRMGLASSSMTLERYTHVSDADVSRGARQAFGAEPITPIKQERNPLLPIKCPRCGAVNVSSDKVCKKCFYSIDYENTERDLTILEIMKSRFLEFEKIDLEKLVKNYRNLKEETKRVQTIFDVFEFDDVVTNDVIQRKLQLNTEECLDTLQYLMSCDFIDMYNDKVKLLKRTEFKNFITVYKRYTELRE